MPLLGSLRVDRTALAWTLLIATVSAILFGVAPAFRISGRNTQEALKESGHGTTEGRSHDRVRATLVVSEVALACVLLIGAGLLLRSFLRVLDVDLGFEPSPEKRAAIWQEIVRRASMIPGVEAAGISDNLPMSRNRSWGIRAKGGTMTVGNFKVSLCTSFRQATSMRLVCA